MRYQDFSVRQKITLSMDAIIIVFILAVLGMQIAVFSGQQGRILRSVRVIFDGQSFSVV